MNGKVECDIDHLSQNRESESAGPGSWQHAKGLLRVFIELAVDRFHKEAGDSTGAVPQPNRNCFPQLSKVAELHAESITWMS